MKAYTSVAEYYDRLNDGVDYEKWADFLALELGEVRSVLDLACGTGNMTFALEARGYDMIGCDLSCDMLAKAREKAEALSSRALFLQQDMTALDLYGTVGGVVSCLDSINYLLSCDALYMCFSGVYKFLEKGGVFIFDCNTPCKFATVYEKNDYILEDDGVLLAWHNEYNEKKRTCDFILDLFTENGDGSYTRSTEYQRDRCYSMRTLKKVAQNAGFTVKNVVSDFEGTPAKETDERWYFILKKEK